MNYHPGISTFFDASQVQSQLELSKFDTPLERKMVERTMHLLTFVPEPLIVHVHEVAACWAGRL